MTSAFYQLPRLSFGTDFATALTSKYGVGVTVYYSDENNVIFSCPAISDKTIRIFKEQVYYDEDEYFDRLNCFYGDSWTSGTTITNPVIFCGDSRSDSDINSMAYIDVADLVLSDSFLIVAFITNIPQMAIIGKLTNNQYLCLGFNGENAYHTNCHGKITDGTVGEVEIPTLSTPFSDDGNFVTMPTMFMISNRVLKNADGSIATMTGLLNVAHGSRVATETCYITRSKYWYNISYNTQIHTGLMCVIG